MTSRRYTTVRLGLQPAGRIEADIIDVSSVYVHVLWPLPTDRLWRFFRLRHRRLRLRKFV
jgi:hypothetical protein